MAVSKNLKALRAANPDMTIRDVSDRAFARYGRVLKGVKATKAVAYARTHATPGEDIVYEPAVAGLEKDKPLVDTLAERVFGGMPIQVGWCFGRNCLLNGLEYHKGVEVVVAVTDMVLLLGDMRDITWGKNGPRYASKKAECFFVPRGSVVECHAWCLHFAPIHVQEKNGFCALIVLPKETNTPIKRPARPKGEDVMLFARNKWLLVHKSAAGLVKEGAWVGITGRNLAVEPIA